MRARARLTPGLHPPQLERRQLDLAGAGRLAGLLDRAETDVADDALDGRARFVAPMQIVALEAKDKEQFKKVAETCKSCHEKYKKKD